MRDIFYFTIIFLLSLILIQITLVKREVRGIYDYVKIEILK